MRKLIDRIAKPKDARLLALGLCALLGIITSGRMSGAINSLRLLEFVPYDWHLRSLPELAPDPRIVVVGMDDDSLSELADLEYPTYPLPRRFHGELTDELHSAGARVVAFDVMFYKEDQDQDLPFAIAARKMGHVLTAITPLLKQGPNGEDRQFLAPPPLLHAVTKQCSVVIATTGGSMRSMEPWPADAVSGERYPFLAVQMAADYLGVKNVEPVLRDDFQYGPIRLPVGADGETLIRYAGPAEKFTYIPYHEVYNGGWKKRDPDMFKDKLVVVGRVSTLEDYHVTPRGSMYGVQILANVAQMILQRETITAASQRANLGWKMTICILAAIALWRFGVRGGIPFAMVLAGACIVVPHEVFQHVRVWFNSVEPLLGLGLTVALGSSYEMVRLRKLVHRILPSDVASEMLRGNADVVSRTTERELTVAFCDIRSFTRMSESLPPERVEIILQMFYKAGQDAATLYHGTVDKFVGDEIMVYFEGTKAEEHHGLRAGRWAVAMMEQAAKLDRSGISGETGFRVGIGIATGMARLGSIAAERIQFTVLGDVVNVASRLQTATKEIRKPVLISESTQSVLNGLLESEPIGEIRVRGREEPVMVYALSVDMEENQNDVEPA